MPFILPALDGASVLSKEKRTASKNISSPKKQEINRNKAKEPSPLKPISDIIINLIMIKRRFSFQIVACSNSGINLLYSASAAGGFRFQLPFLFRAPQYGLLHEWLINGAQ